MHNRIIGATIIQAVHHSMEFMRNNIVHRVNTQFFDPEIHKTYYKCETYTQRADLNLYQDKGQSIDIKA